MNKRSVQLPKGPHGMVLGQLGTAKANIIMDASAGIWGTPTSYANEAEAIADFQRQNITAPSTERGFGRWTGLSTQKRTVDPPEASFHKRWNVVECFVLIHSGRELDSKVLNAADILAMTCADTMSSANVQGVGSLLIFLGALVAHF